MNLYIKLRVLSTMLTSVERAHSKIHKLEAWISKFERKEWDRVVIKHRGW